MASMTEVDARCTAPGCKDDPTYRMVGSCLNCGLQDLVITFTVGHSAKRCTCPHCGCDNVMPRHWVRAPKKEG